MRVGVIFDLDDTILATSPIYYKCLFEVALLIEDSVYPKFVIPEQILQVYHSVEKVGLADDSEGYYKKFFQEGPVPEPAKFPIQMVQFYIEACTSVGVVPTKEGAVKAHEIGMKIYRENYRMAPGMKKLLDYLDRSKNASMFMITHGTEELQRPKIESKLIFKRFEKIYIAPMTTNKADYIKKLMEDYDNIDVWVMVGDSVPSDINPALGCGILAFHCTSLMSHVADGKLLSTRSALERYKQFRDTATLQRCLQDLLNIDEGTCTNAEKIPK